MLRRMALSPSHVLSIVALVAGCGPSLPADTTAHGAGPPPSPVPNAAPPAPLAAASVAPATSSYQGHGVASVSPEILAKFAPVPLPSDVSRRIQALMDVRSPSAGYLTPDGKTLYFGWSISGTRQSAMPSIGRQTS